MLSAVRSAKYRYKKKIMSGMRCSRCGDGSLWDHRNGCIRSNDSGDCLNNSSCVSGSVMPSGRSSMAAYTFNAPTPTTNIS